jgi:hypothetical protein
MARRFVLVLAPLVLLLHGAAGAQAEWVIWDFSPATTGSEKVSFGTASVASGQNVADNFSIAKPFVITGMDSYSVIPALHIFGVLHNNAGVCTFIGAVGCSRPTGPVFRDRR